MSDYPPLKRVDAYLDVYATYVGSLAAHHSRDDSRRGLYATERLRRSNPT